MIDMYSFNAKIIKWLLLMWVMVVLASCNKIKPTPPVESTLDTILQPPFSVIHLPVQYRVSALQEMINEKIKGKFVNKWMTLSESGDSLHLEITRQAEIKLRRDRNTLFYSVPLKISGSVKAKIAGVKIKNATPVSAEIVAHLATNIHLNEKWELITSSKLVRIDWIKEPKLKVAFANINLRGAIDKFLSSNEEHLIAKADQAARQLLNTRKVVEKLWNDIQKPIRINKKGVDVWLKATGHDLSGYLEETDPDLISLMIRLQAITRIYVEGDVVPPANLVLPAFHRSEQHNDSLIVYAHASLPFNAINKVLTDELTGKPLSAKGFSTSIKHVRVYGTREGIAIELKVKGDVDGLVYVRGTPVFDTVSYTLRIDRFNFDIDSENSLLNSADWLLHSKLLDLISEKLIVDVKPIAARLPEIIMQAIEKGKTGEKIDIKVDTLHVQPQTLLVTRKNLQVIARASGRATLELEKKLFEKKRKK